MSELLERIRGEIHERLAASRAAAEEYQRLEAALAALGQPASADGRPAPVRRPRRAAEGSRRPTTGRSRAPRGANREAALRVLRERPGVGVSELAAATAIDKPVLYALLSRLVDDGEVVKEDLPSGSTGYALAREDATTSTPTSASQSEPRAIADEHDTSDQSAEAAGEHTERDASVSALAA
jgi:hypothetical protein